MTQPLLSILIPTVVGREENLKKLLSSLRKDDVRHLADELIIGSMNMIFDNVEIIFLKDNKEMTVGEKRNRLYQMAKGLYSFMPDDDDTVANDFIEKILKAIESEPDCITYYEHVDIDGDISKSNHSIKYSGWHDNPTWPEGFKYARTPYFKDVIKTEIAKSVEVPEIRWNEDEQWSNALLPYLKTEVHIDAFMYFYKHVSSNPTERYGLDK